MQLFSRVKRYLLFKNHIYSLNKSVYMFVNVLKLPQSQSDNLCVHMRGRARERERGRPKAVSVLHPTLCEPSLLLSAQDKETLHSDRSS